MNILIRAVDVLVHRDVILLLITIVLLLAWAGCLVAGVVKVLKA